MLSRLLDFLTGREAPALEERTDELQLSVAALLIEAARMDSTFDAAERGTIGRLLTDKFHLAPDAVQMLVEQAEQKVQYSAQYFPFTHEICKRLSPEERIGIVEMMWTVAYSDGILDPHEDMLLRQIAGLIHVPDKERGLARQRALKRAATATPPATPRDAAYGGELASPISCFGRHRCRLRGILRTLMRKRRNVSFGSTADLAV
jgi:uncharacterized tellurite resistance protein B-like protein